MAVCRLDYPTLELKAPGHWAACHAILPATHAGGARVHPDAGNAASVPALAGQIVAPGASGGVEAGSTAAHA
jgi:hypothetical protein